MEFMYNYLDLLIKNQMILRIKCINNIENNGNKFKIYINF